MRQWIIIEQWIAYHLQYPGEKIKWAIVLVSAIEGTGKGLLARIVSRILGSDNVNENANYKHLTNTHNTLLIGTQVLVLNEVSLGDFKGKAEGTNTLKNFIGDDVYTCNFKGKPMVKLPNLTNMIVYSNDVRVVSANQGVRRYFFCNLDKTEEEIMEKDTKGLFKKLWDFVDSDLGASALLHHFNRVAIPNPEIFKKRAPITEDLQQLIEQSKHPVIKKLEWDLKRTDGRNKLFKSNFCGLMSFDELNDKLNTKERFDAMSDNYDWGSYGDDALYKFLATNCTRWNNGDTTRQISINGTKYRMYILDDARCPIPNKSYKDLTPKQIEIIHGDYARVVREIENEEKEYLDSKENLPGLKELFKENIRLWIDIASDRKKNKWSTAKPGFKKITVEEGYNKVMDGTITLEGNDTHDRNRIKLMEFRLQRGIRTPEQIIEDIPKGDPKYQIEHKGEFKPKLDDEKISKDHITNEFSL